MTAFYETDDYMVFSFVCQSKVYNSYYSKKTGKLVFANLFLNDLFSFITGGTIAAVSDDNVVISYYEPYSIDPLKAIYNKSQTDGKVFMEELLKPFNVTGSLPSNMSVYKNLVEHINYSPTAHEIEFINSISPTDNPILIFHHLKNDEK